MFCVGFTVMCALAGTPNERIWIDADGLVRDMRNAATGRRVAEEFRAQRIEVINKLIAILRAPKEPLAMRIAAVKILGTLRAEEAVPVLIENLTISPAYINEKTFAIVCPAVYALIKIGKPASRAALQCLKSEDSAIRVKWLCHIIKEVEGKQVAISLLKSELGKSQGKASKKKLQAALNKVSE